MMLCGYTSTLVCLDGALRWREANCNVSDSDQFVLLSRTPFSIPKLLAIERPRFEVEHLGTFHGHAVNARIIKI